MLHRRSPRLPAYDYREPGMYFITICTYDRECVLGEVIDDEVVLSPVGRVAHDEWQCTPALRPYVHSEAFVVMPNHVHLLFGLWTEEGAGMPPWLNDATDDQCRDKLPRRAKAPRRDKARLVPTETGIAPTPPGAPLPMSVPAIIGAYKSSVTRLARRTGAWGDGPLWQGRYHDRVVRNERERIALHAYSLDNPRRWHEDRFYSPPFP